jgi:hypothetical protein
MPLPSTLTPIATNTLTANAASVSFTNIPQTYTDLVLVYYFGDTSAAVAAYVEYNGDAYTNLKYSGTRLYGNGTSATSSRRSNDPFYLTDGTPTSTTLGVNQGIVNIMNYSNATTFKTSLVRDNNANAGTEAVISLWQRTDAINRVDIKNTSTGNFLSGSSFTIYGVKAA